MGSGNEFFYFLGKSARETRDEARFSRASGLLEKRLSVK
jgi:hypothetical protein